MTTTFELPAELERFALQCVEDGGYADVGEVVRSALQLLHDRDAGRRQFTQMLLKTEAEADHSGAFEIVTVMTELDAVIVGAER